MAFTVELTIRGLCALVPSEVLRFEGEQTIERMTVLLVDERKPRVITDRTRTPIDLDICGHLPLLRYPRPGENKLSGFWILEGYRIDISDIDTAQPLVVRPGYGKWSQMSRVIPQSQARVDPKFLTPLPPAGIAATLNLENGFIDAFDDTGVWEFQPPLVAPLQPYRDRFAAAVSVSIPIRTNQAVLRAMDRSGSVSFQEVLQPRSTNPPGNTVNLLLSNLCFEEEEDRNRTVESDFAVFYDLLANYNGIFHVPHRGSGSGSAPGTVPGPANAGPNCVGTNIDQ